MTGEKELFERALGADEPPLALDVESFAPTRTRRPRPLVPLAVTAAAVAVVVGGAALFTMRGSSGPSGTVVAAGGASSSPTVVVEEPSVRDIAYCYQTADITSRAPNQHVPIGINGSGKDGRGDAAAVAMQICAKAWQNNYYKWQSAGDSRGQHTFATPALVMCVLDSGVTSDVQSGAVGVFPGDAQTCARLGLPVAQLPAH